MKKPKKNKKTVATTITSENHHLLYEAYQDLKFETNIAASLHDLTNVALSLAKTEDVVKGYKSYMIEKLLKKK